MGLGVSLEVIFFPMVFRRCRYVDYYSLPNGSLFAIHGLAETNGVLAESMNVAVAEQARSLDPLAQD